MPPPVTNKREEELILDEMYKIIKDLEKEIKELKSRIKKESKIKKEGLLLKGQYPTFEAIAVSKIYQELGKLMNLYNYYHNILVREGKIR